MIILATKATKMVIGFICISKSEFINTVYINLKQKSFKSYLYFSY